MQEKQRIILYGDTLVLEGVRSSLGISTNIEVIALGTPPSHMVSVRIKWWCLA
jgi:hypothetical protein